MVNQMSPNHRVSAAPTAAKKLRQHKDGAATPDEIVERVLKTNDELWKSDKSLRLLVGRAKHSRFVHLLETRRKLLEHLQGSAPLRNARLRAGVASKDFHDMMAECVAEFVCLRSELRSVLESGAPKHLRAARELASLELEGPLNKELSGMSRAFVELHDAQRQFGGARSLEKRAFDALILSLAGLHAALTLDSATSVHGELSAHRGFLVSRNNTHPLYP